MRHAKRATLGKRLRTTRPKAAVFTAARTLGLVKSFWTSPMLWSLVAIHWATMAFMRWIHRTAIALRLRLAPLMFATVLTIHGWTAKAIASRALIRMAISSVGRIHWARPAFLRGIYRTTLSVALWLCAPALSPYFRPGRIAIWARLVTPFWGGRRVRCGSGGKWLHSSGRLICGLGFLGLQWNATESDDPTKPGERVGFRFHVRVLVGLTAKEETLVGNKSFDTPASPHEIHVLKSATAAVQGGRWPSNEALTALVFGVSAPQKNPHSLF